MTISRFCSVLGENTRQILDGLCGQVPAGTTYQYPLHSLLLRFVTDLFYNDGRFNISYSSGKRFVFKSSAERGLGCARFHEILQNFSERQILWCLCSVDFHTFTLQLPIQTLHSVVPELQVFVSSLENCQNFNKTSTPLVIHLPQS